MATPAAVELQAERRRSGSSALSFTTTDCARAFAELRDRGAVFGSEAERRGYGGVGFRASRVEAAAIACWDETI